MTGHLRYVSEIHRLKRPLGLYGEVALSLTRGMTQTGHGTILVRVSIRSNCLSRCISPWNDWFDRPTVSLISISTVCHFTFVWVERLEAVRTPSVWRSQPALRHIKPPLVPAKGDSGYSVKRSQTPPPPLGLGTKPSQACTPPPLGLGTKPSQAYTWTGRWHGQSRVSLLKCRPIMWKYSYLEEF